MKYSAEQLKEILLENDYPASNPKMLESVITQLMNLGPEGQAAFYEWCDSRNLPKFSIEGIDVNYLKTYHGMTDIAVVLAYDGLIKNPKSAYLLKKPVIKRM